MLNIEQAKNQATLLVDYLLTVNKRLKHTHALEAVARINGHKSWNTFQSSAEDRPEQQVTPLDLARLLLSSDFSHVVIEDLRYVRHEHLASLDTELKAALAGDTSVDLDQIVMTLKSEVVDGRGYEASITLRELMAARYANGLWLLSESIFLYAALQDSIGMVELTPYKVTPALPF